MRYLGNKTKLLYFIESVINKYNINGESCLKTFYNDINYSCFNRSQVFSSQSHR